MNEKNQKTTGPHNPDPRKCSVELTTSNGTSVVIYEDGSVLVTDEEGVKTFDSSNPPPPPPPPPGH